MTPHANIKNVENESLYMKSSIVDSHNISVRYHMLDIRGALVTLLTSVSFISHF